MDLNVFVTQTGRMFTPYCDTHGSRVLLGYESVVSIEQTPSGPKVTLQCYCGDLVVQDSIAAASALTA
jgi:hypothetical protein